VQPAGQGPPELGPLLEALLRNLAKEYALFMSALPTFGECMPPLERCKLLVSAWPNIPDRELFGEVHWGHEGGGDCLLHKQPWYVADWIARPLWGSASPTERRRMTVPLHGPSV